MPSRQVSFSEEQDGDFDDDDDDEEGCGGGLGGGLISRRGVVSPACSSSRRSGKHARTEEQEDDDDDDDDDEGYGGRRGGVGVSRRGVVSPAEAKRSSPSAKTLRRSGKNGRREDDDDEDDSFGDDDVPFASTEGMDDEFVGDECMRDEDMDEDGSMVESPGHSKLYRRWLSSMQKRCRGKKMKVGSVMQDTVDEEEDEIDKGGQGDKDQKTFAQIQVAKYANADDGEYEFDGETTETEYDESGADKSA